MTRYHMHHFHTPHIQHRNRERERVGVRLTCKTVLNVIMKHIFIINIRKFRVFSWDFLEQ